MKKRNKLRDSMMASESKTYETESTIVMKSPRLFRATGTALGLSKADSKIQLKVPKIKVFKRPSRFQKQTQSQDIATDLNTLVVDKMPVHENFYKTLVKRYITDKVKIQQAKEMEQEEKDKSLIKPFAQTEKKNEALPKLKVVKLLKQKDKQEEPTLFNSGRIRTKISLSRLLSFEQTSDIPSIELIKQVQTTKNKKVTFFKSEETEDKVPEASKPPIIPKLDIEEKSFVDDSVRIEESSRISTSSEGLKVPKVKVIQFEKLESSRKNTSSSMLDSSSKTSRSGSKSPKANLLELSKYKSTKAGHQRPLSGGGLRRQKLHTPRRGSASKNNNSRIGVSMISEEENQIRKEMKALLDAKKQIYPTVDIKKLVKFLTPFLDLDFSVNTEKVAEYMVKFRQQIAILTAGRKDMLKHEIKQIESQMRIKHDFKQLAKKRQKAMMGSDGFEALPKIMGKIDDSYKQTSGELVEKLKDKRQTLVNYIQIYEDLNLHHGRPMRLIVEARKEKVYQERLKDMKKDHEEVTQQSMNKILKLERRGASKDNLGPGIEVIKEDESQDLDSIASNKLKKDNRNRQKRMIVDISSSDSEDYITPVNKTSMITEANAPIKSTLNRDDTKKFQRPIEEKTTLKDSDDFSIHSESIPCSEGNLSLGSLNQVIQDNNVKKKDINRLVMDHLEEKMNQFKETIDQQLDEVDAKLNLKAQPSQEQHLEHELPDFSDGACSEDSIKMEEVCDLPAVESIGHFFKYLQMKLHRVILDSKDWNTDYFKQYVKYLYKNQDVLNDFVSKERNQLQVINRFMRQQNQDSEEDGSMTSCRDTIKKGMPANYNDFIGIKEASYETENLKFIPLCQLYCLREELSKKQISYIAHSSCDSFHFSGDSHKSEDISVSLTSEDLKKDTGYDIDLIDQILLKLKFFKCFAYETRLKLIQSCRYEMTYEGQCIFSELDSEDQKLEKQNLIKMGASKKDLSWWDYDPLFNRETYTKRIVILLNGHASLWSHKPKTGIRYIHQSLVIGESIGDSPMAAQQNEDERFSLWSNTACDLLHIDKDLFKEILVNDFTQIGDLKEKIDALRLQMSLNDATNYSLMLLSNMIQIQTYKFGDVVIEQDEIPEFWYIMVEGECKTAVETMLVKTKAQLNKLKERAKKTDDNILTRPYKKDNFDKAMRTGLTSYKKKALGSEFQSKSGKVKEANFFSNVFYQKQQVDDFNIMPLANPVKCYNNSDCQELEMSILREQIDTNLTEIRTGEVCIPTEFIESVYRLQFSGDMVFSNRPRFVINQFDRKTLDASDFGHDMKIALRQKTLKSSCRNIINLHEHMYINQPPLARIGERSNIWAFRMPVDYKDPRVIISAEGDKSTFDDRDWGFEVMHLNGFGSAFCSRVLIPTERLKKQIRRNKELYLKLVGGKERILQLMYEQRYKQIAQDMIQKANSEMMAKARIIKMEFTPPREEKPAIRQSNTLKDASPLVSFEQTGLSPQQHKSHDNKSPSRSRSMPRGQTSFYTKSPSKNMLLEVKEEESVTSLDEYLLGSQSPLQRKEKKAIKQKEQEKLDPFKYIEKETRRSITGFKGEAAIKLRNKLNRGLKDTLWSVSSNFQGKSIYEQKKKAAIDMMRQQSNFSSLDIGLKQTSLYPSQMLETNQEVDQSLMDKLKAKEQEKNEINAIFNLLMRSQVTVIANSRKVRILKVNPKCLEFLPETIRRAIRHNVMNQFLPMPKIDQNEDAPAQTTNVRPKDWIKKEFGPYPAPKSLPVSKPGSQKQSSSSAVSLHRISEREVTESSDDIEIKSDSEEHQVKKEEDDDEDQSGSQNGSDDEDGPAQQLYTDEDWQNRALNPHRYNYVDLVDRPFCTEKELQNFINANQSWAKIRDQVI